MPTPTKYDGQLVRTITFRISRRWTEEAHHTDLNDDGFACSASYLRDWSEEPRPQTGVLDKPAILTEPHPMTEPHPNTQHNMQMNETVILVSDFLTELGH